MKRIIKWLHLKGVKRTIYFFLVNHVYAGTKHFEIKRRLLKSLGFEIGENTKIVGPIVCTGQLKIGKNCWIGKSFLVNGSGTVVIGDNCDIAPEVTFQTGSHSIGTAERRAGMGYNYQQTVGSGCWIGVRATILNEVTIGASSIIAGCACVTKDVEEHVLVGGVPAKIIRRLNENDKLI